MTSCAAAYYTSFLSVAFVVYYLRKRGYRSLPEAINLRYGSLATVCMQCPGVATAACMWRPSEIECDQ